MNSEEHARSRQNWCPDGFGQRGWRSRIRRIARAALCKSALDHSLFDCCVQLSRIERAFHPTPAWLAGVVDGDGHVCAKQERTIEIGVTQVDSALLTEIKKMFGGSVRVTRRATGEERTRWRWSVQAAGPLASILKTLRPLSILKVRQIDLALTFLATVTLSRQRLALHVRRQRASIVRRISALNGRGSRSPHGVGEVAARLGDEVHAYLGGMFECEGTIGMTKEGELHLAVKMTDRRVPLLFARVFGGTVRFAMGKQGRQPTWRWAVKTRAAATALWHLLPWLVTKRAQAQLALAARATIIRPGRLRDDQRHLRQSASADIKRLKRSTIEEEEYSYVEARTSRRFLSVTAPERPLGPTP